MKKCSDTSDPLIRLEKELSKNKMPLNRRAALFKKLKWEFVRENEEYRKEYNTWLNHTDPTMENLKSEYEKFSKKWGYPPANPDMPFPNTALILGEWEGINPLNLPFIEKYKKHIQCGAEDRGIDKFFVDEYGHVVNVDWMSIDKFDYPLEKLEHVSVRCPLGPFFEEDIKTIGITINLLYPKEEILSILKQVLERFGKHIEYKDSPMDEATEQLIKEGKEVPWGTTEVV